MFVKIKRAIILFFHHLRGKDKEYPSNEIATYQSSNQPTLPPYILHLLSTYSKRYDGKLLLRQEINITESIFQQCLQFHIFQKVDSIEHRFFQTICVRCNNSNKALFAFIDCKKCRRKHVYCRNCIHMGRIVECEPLYYWSGKKAKWEKYIEPCTWNGNLSPSQEEASNQIVTSIIERSELLIWAVTGSGKTEMLFAGINCALQKGYRICIASPRADVVRELLPRLKSAFQPVHIQGLYSGSKDNDGTAQFIVATTHQLLRFRRAFDVLIIDEIDAFPYYYDSALQFATEQAVKKKSAKIYLTATPRKKQKHLMEIGKLKYVFVPVRFHGHSLVLPTLIFEAKLATILQQNKMPPSFIKWLENRKNKTRQLLVFVPTICLAEELLKPIVHVLKRVGSIQEQKEVATVHAEDSLRAEKIELYRERQIYALITTTILERGVTFPSIDVAVLYASHAVFDEQALVQIAGRAGRSIEDPTGEVVFFHDGLTDAIVSARKEIKKMNERGKQLKKEMRRH